MNYRLIWLRRWLALVSMPILLGLALGAVHAPTAAAENVPNPLPALVARWEPCEPNTGVTVIVDNRKIGNGMIDVGCAPGEQANGVEALQHAGFALEGTLDLGLAFVCRIDGEPTPAEDGCETTPGAGAYWSYWRGKPGGRWAYSGTGAKSPESRSPINSVEGWSFGGGNAPRIEPMDGSGPSTFRLPPEQESSVIPAELAREWLVPVLDQTALQAQEQEARAEAEGSDDPGPEAIELLPQAIALATAGTEPAELKPIASWLARSCKEGRVTVEGCPLRELANPNTRREQDSPQRFALAVLGLRALGQSPEDFAGMDPRGELEGMIKKSTGQLASGGELSEAIEATAPTVLALARTGALSEAALKTVDLILAQQRSTGRFEEEGTLLDVQAIEALLAAREQGASVLGESRLERIREGLSKAGGYLEGIEEPGGGVPSREGAKPTVESSALGAVGLALAGRRAAGERAARWVSRYQVTAEYAGTGNSETGERTPAEDVIGAFLPEEAGLRNALAYGVPSSSLHGLYFEARSPTADALLALVSAGPYGPYDASFDQQSLLFEPRTVGSPSRALTATMTNRDVRSVTIGGVGLTGEGAGDFRVESGGCAGRTLSPGESCEVSVSFDPTGSGAREALLGLALGGTGQTVQLPVSGTGQEPESKTAEPQETGTVPKAGSGAQSVGGTVSSSGGAGVLGSRITGPVIVGMPFLDARSAGRGLVGVSWRLEPAAGARSWVISARKLGSRSFVALATGDATVTHASLKLPPGSVYELQITFADLLTGSSTVRVGKVVVPYDDRWGSLRYSGRWQRLRRAGAWLDTVSRGGGGSQVLVRLTAGRPVFLLRAAAHAARLELRVGSRRQTVAVPAGPAAAVRQITAAERSRGGMVSLRVLNGTIDLDGVAVEG